MTDQIAKKYPVKTRSLRWTLQIFYNIFDLNTVNAWILYKEITGKFIRQKQGTFLKKKKRFCHARICHNNETNNICESVRNMFPGSVRK